MQRREFLRTAAAAGLAAATPTPGVLAEPEGQAEASSSGGMEYRTLGRTGERVSCVGLGGYHVGIQQDPQESVRLVRMAIDNGINFMDNCWDYNDGASEERMGQALKDGYRKRVFLMTKLDGRTKQSYQQQLEQSLQRLQVETIDLVQFHEVLRLEDPDRIFAPGGAMEAAVAAKQAGKLRYIGFTGHKDPYVHLRMFEVAKQHSFHFDTVQMPVNVLDAHFRSFAKQVIPVAQREGTGVLAMKTLAGGAVPKTGTVAVVEALKYVLSQPVSVAIMGMPSQQVLEQGLGAGRNFKPLSEQEQAAILAKTREVALTGRYETFKTSSNYDGTARNPEWLG